MDDQQRDETIGEPEGDTSEPLPLEMDSLPVDDQVADALAYDSARLEIAFDQPEEADEVLAREIERLQEGPQLDTDLTVEAFTGDMPLTPQEAVFGKAPSPGRLNVGFQPHARRIPIAYEPQPSFETPEDVASAIIRGPRRPADEPAQLSDFLFSSGDSGNEPRVQLLSDERPAQEPAQQSSVSSGATDESTAPGERGQTLPRLLVTVSMANARSIFQDCMERASQSLGAKFHAACQSTVDDYARDRRAAERAANRWSR